MKISFLGGGNMAAALLGGLLRQGFAASDLQVVELLPEGRERLAREFDVRTTAGIDEAWLDCDVLVLAVKPQQMRAALAPMVGRLSRQCVLSIAAGLRLEDLSRWLGGHAQLVRAMPNTPALIGRGMTGLFAGPQVGAEARAAVTRVLSAVGRCEWVEDEALIDAVTAVSGSGPAYVFYFIEALQAAGVELGLTPDVARALALETVAGAATLAQQSSEPVGVLRERVTSKGGTTAAALAVMAQEDLPARIARAVAAAARRGAELGDELGRDGD